MFENCRKLIKEYREQVKTSSAFTLAWEAEIEINKLQEELLLISHDSVTPAIPSCESCIGTYGKCEFKHGNDDCRTFWRRVHA